MNRTNRVRGCCPVAPGLQGRQRQSGQAAFRSWECRAQPNRSQTATRPRQVLFQPSPRIITNPLGWT